MKSAPFIAFLLMAGCVRHTDGEPSRPLPTRALVNQPFGQHRFEYADGSILPTIRSTAELDQATIDFYERWKQNYLKPSCGSKAYHVAAHDDARGLTSSEAVGYGMVIVSLMAGHDPRAREYFDGLLNFVRAHQSALTQGLMAARQDRACRDIEGDTSSTNGDLDIAYALLLADKQWGSCHGVEYSATARGVITAISDAALHRAGRYMLLGDWVAPSDQDHYNTTRSSDFAPGHFRGFQHFMRQEWWVQVIDNGYWLLETVRTRYSPERGFFPDVIEAADSQAPEPARADFLPGSGGGEFREHARLVPLRVGADFLVSGDMRAKRLLVPLTQFLSEHAPDPSGLAAAYTLSGEPIATNTNMTLTASMGVAAMLDKSHQTWLDQIWSHLEAQADEDVYSDSVRLLAMLMMSGNWWAPDSAPNPCGELALASR